MLLATHASSWRSFVTLMPVLAVGLVIYAVGQGQHELAQSWVVYLGVAAVTVPGVVVPWLVNRRVSRTPVVPLAQARPGYVTLRGRAAALPGANLVSPDGNECVWFVHAPNYRKGQRYQIDDSARLFILVDGEQRCLVDPVGAEIEGAKQASKGGHERVLVAGDVLQVTGTFTATGGALAARHPDVQPLAALPAIGAAGASAPCFIWVGQGDVPLYGLALRVNAVLMALALGAAAWFFRAGS